MLSTILGHIISVGAIALIVVFQPEIRRFLQKIGMSQKRFNFISRIFNHGSKIAETHLQPLVVACREMSDTKTGALVVIGQQSDLSLITEGGICLDAKISSQLIHNIFFKNSPLHDGAMVIADDRIAAARCVLPSTEREVPMEFGMRHRAALGASEITDALVIVVSEERGTISIARKGHISRDISPAHLQVLLRKGLSV